jgi:DNA-directed RNA polymerase subunit RPC12/RpoP
MSASDTEYLCSRCGGSYRAHKAVWFEEAGKWMWKCKDGKFREVIRER